MFKKELYNFESLYGFIQRICAVLANALLLMTGHPTLILYRVFQKSFTTFKAYMNLLRGPVQFFFELP
jgi:hypothetical protein